MGNENASGAKRKKPKLTLAAWDPKSSLVKEIQTNLKLTEAQILRCYDMYRLSLLDKEDEDQYTAFRLDVKLRIKNQFLEELR